jgi:hypothetical protein
MFDPVGGKTISCVEAPAEIVALAFDSNANRALNLQPSLAGMNSALLEW